MDILIKTGSGFSWTSGFENFSFVKLKDYRLPISLKNMVVDTEPFILIWSILE